MDFLGTYVVYGDCQSLDKSVIKQINDLESQWNCHNSAKSDYSV